MRKHPAETGVGGISCRTIAFFALFAFALSPSMRAQITLHTYTTPHGAFQFKYSATLVRCTEQRQPGDWFPEESCDAVSPVCDDPGIQETHTLVCFAYPNQKFEEYPEFEAAAFAVAEIRGISKEEQCLKNPPEWTTLDPKESGGSIDINGVRFKVFVSVDVAAGNYLETRAFRNFHESICYELSIRIATSNPGNYEPPVKTMTQQDWNGVNGLLKKSLASFTFLK